MRAEVRRSRWVPGAAGAASVATGIRVMICVIRVITGMRLDVMKAVYWDSDHDESKRHQSRLLG